jgi:RimJ/RimL family protein N-acetyltransferase
VNGSARLTSKRLTYEPLASQHAAGLVVALGDERVGRYIGGPDVTTLDAARERIEYLRRTDPATWGERWLNWVVFADDLPDRPLIGRVEATVHIERSPVSAEIAYLFGPAWWGRGYATEATAWMIDRLAADHGVRTVWATVDPANSRSIGLLVRLGFAEAPLPPQGIASYEHGDVVMCRLAAL